MTIEALAPWYLWLKAIHLMADFAWMAGLLYLPRLFVYHRETVPGSADSARFMVMERRLLRGIMSPAMIIAVVFGVLLVLTPGVVDWHDGWWHTKLLCVILLLGYHHMLMAERKRLAKDVRKRSARYWRIMNEVPAVLLVIIVIMVIVKPF